MVVNTSKSKFPKTNIVFMEVIKQVKSFHTLEIGCSEISTSTVNCLKKAGSQLSCEDLLGDWGTLAETELQKQVKPLS